MKDYEGIIEAAKGSIKAKQLTAQLIPRFFKYFPSLSERAIFAHFDLCEEEELGVSECLFSLILRGLYVVNVDCGEIILCFAKYRVVKSVNCIRNFDVGI